MIASLLSIICLTNIVGFIYHIGFVPVTCYCTHTLIHIFHVCLCAFGNLTPVLYTLALSFIMLIFCYSSPFIHFQAVNIMTFTSNL